MEELIENFSEQIGKAIHIGEHATLTQATKKIGHVVIAGMGGSGIGGTIVAEIVSRESSVPIAVSKNYFLPQFVNENTLVIACSYSGNTEETLHALTDAEGRGATIVCIASGGKLLERASMAHMDYIKIPDDVIASGVSSPRAALGYSLVEIFFVLYHFGIISADFKAEFLSACALLQNEKESIKHEAQRVAEAMLGKLPVIYAPFGSLGVAIRFKQQLNENAKMLAWYSEIPEMNHNELLGWEGGGDNIVALIFRNSTDYERIQERITFSKAAILHHTPTVIEVFSKGSSAIERMLYHVHIGDFISLYLSKLRNVNPNDLGIIEKLKTFLSQDNNNY
jgi:glucose/mannose-6-phosphate isomerase